MLYTVQVKLETTLTVQIEANTAEEASESAHDAALDLIDEGDCMAIDLFDTTTVDISPRD
jgi:hypothetical protein